MDIKKIIIYVLIMLLCVLSAIYFASYNDFIFVFICGMVFMLYLDLLLDAIREYRLQNKVKRLEK